MVLEITSRIFTNAQFSSYQNVSSAGAVLRGYEKAATKHVSNPRNVSVKNQTRNLSVDLKWQFNDKYHALGFIGAASSAKAQTGPIKLVALSASVTRDKLYHCEFYQYTVVDCLLAQCDVMNSKSDCLLIIMITGTS